MIEVVVVGIVHMNIVHIHILGRNLEIVGDLDSLVVGYMLGIRCWEIVVGIGVGNLGFVVVGNG